MRIIPAIDIIEGQCVRLSEGDYNTKKVYSHDPVQVAIEFEDAGVRYLHVVDLDGAKSDGVVNHKVLEEICSKTDLIVDFGGGIKSDDDMKKVFDSGAHQVTIGSMAVKKPALFDKWLQRYGAERIILGADCKSGYVATNGWLDVSKWNVLDFIQEYIAKGVESIICTDIAMDGMLKGPSCELYKKILEEVDVKLIASGGVSSMEDLVELKSIGCDGAIVGKALYEGYISLDDLKQFLC